MKNDVLELEIPERENPLEFMENFFGCAPTPHDEMPSAADSEETFIIELK